MFCRKLHKVFLLLSLMLFLGAKQPERQRRVALVIGNGAYLRMTRLSNPPQDVRDVGRKLEALGFEVLVRENLTRAGMEKSIEEFVKTSSGAAVAMFYYSGHGIQLNGSNYLIPVDAELPEDEAGMHRQAVLLEWAVSEMTRVAKVSLIFMDACRNNPGLDEKLPGTGRDGTRDVRLVRVPPGTVYVLYAASKGHRALDGIGKSRNSPFAEAVLEHISDPEPVQLIATSIIRKVKTRTNQQQRPEQQGNLDDRVYLTDSHLTAPPSTRFNVHSNQPPRLP